MTELQDKLQAAEAGSPELDRELWHHFGFETVQLGATADWGKFLVKPEPGRPTRIRLQALTTSIDAALALIKEVLPGWSVLMAITPEKTVCDVHEKPLGTVGKWTGHASHKSPALALCLALLSAVEGGSNDRT